MEEYMENFELIKKGAPPKGVPLNLANYDETYSSFKWETGESEIEFFEDGKLNIAYNAIERHLKDNADKKALIWIDGEQEKIYTYGELSKLSNKFANVLKGKGIKKGDRVFLFLPRIPELYVSFLGITKAGICAGTMFAAFGPAAILDRLSDSEAVAIITNKDLKQRVDQIKDKLPNLKHVILVDGDEGEGIDFWKEMDKASDEFEIEHMDREDPAFMLYTSGTTGKPKGVIHKHYGIVHQHLTAKWILDMHKDDIYWCTADPGWVTGIAYGIIGPFSNCLTQVVSAQRFSVDNWYNTIEKYKVSIWYTAPTAIRMIMKESPDRPSQDLSSLRHLASVGEPLNPEAMRWGLNVFGLAFHDTWWQTETGGILIANYASMDIRQGSMGRPFPGIVAGIVDDEGNELPRGEEGNLAIRPGWPSMMKEIYKRPDKYDSYFKNNWYFSGDRAVMDYDGYIWFVGRADDVINTSGERVGPFEVESALIEHPAVAEAGVIGKPDKLRGEIIKAFITLNKGFSDSEEFHEELKKFVKKHLAGHAYPREIEVVDKLPKTRSGKIMRRVLKAKELGQDIGDTSTLSDD